jgi:hypothetical protein
MVFRPFTGSANDTLRALKLGKQTRQQGVVAARSHIKEADVKPMRLPVVIYFLNTSHNGSIIASIMHAMLVKF